MRNSYYKNLGKFNSLKNLNDGEQFSYVFMDFSIGLFRTFYEQLKKVTSKAVAHRCSSKEVFLKILQISQENTCVVGLRPATSFQRDSRTSL